MSALEPAVLRAALAAFPAVSTYFKSSGDNFCKDVIPIFRILSKVTIFSLLIIPTDTTVDDFAIEGIAKTTARSVPILIAFIKVLDNT